MKEVRDVLKQISELDEKMKIIEDAIGVQTEILKELFLKYSLSMKHSQNYLLTGIQTSPTSKSYLVTFRGIRRRGDPCPDIYRKCSAFRKLPQEKD